VLTPREPPSMQQPMNLKEHWNHVYQTKAHDDVSWYQSRPATSLKLIEACGVSKREGIIDVGDGCIGARGFLARRGIHQAGGFIRQPALDFVYFDTCLFVQGHARKRVSFCWAKRSVARYPARTDLVRLGVLQSRALRPQRSCPSRPPRSARENEPAKCSRARQVEPLPRRLSAHPAREQSRQSSASNR